MGEVLFSLAPALRGAVASSLCIRDVSLRQPQKKTTVNPKTGVLSLINSARPERRSG